MTPNEMKARLDKGESPLDVAIKKWEKIVANDGAEFRRSGSGGDNCALCFVYLLCADCPACGINKNPLDCCHGLYWAWAENKNIRTAQEVLDFLRGLKEKEAA